MSYKCNIHHLTWVHLSHFTPLELLCLATCETHAHVRGLGHVLMRVIPTHGVSILGSTRKPASLWCKKDWTFTFLPRIALEFSQLLIPTVSFSVMFSSLRGGISCLSNNLFCLTYPWPFFSSRDEPLVSPQVQRCLHHSSVSSNTPSIDQVYDIWCRCIMFKPLDEWNCW